MIHMEQNNTFIPNPSLISSPFGRDPSFQETAFAWISPEPSASQRSKVALISWIQRWKALAPRFGGRIMNDHIKWIQMGCRAGVSCAESDGENCENLLFLTIVDWKPGMAWNTHRTDLETNQRWIERLINLICITLHEPTWTFPWHHPKGIGTTTLQRDLKEHVGQLASLRFYGKWHTYSNWWISAWNGDATFVDNSMMIALAALHINESSTKKLRTQCIPIICLNPRHARQPLKPRKICYQGTGVTAAPPSACQLLATSNAPSMPWAIFFHKKPRVEQKKNNRLKEDDINWFRIPGHEPWLVAARLDICLVMFRKLPDSMGINKWADSANFPSTRFMRRFVISTQVTWNMYDVHSLSTG